MFDRAAMKPLYDTAVQATWRKQTMPRNAVGATYVVMPLGPALSFDGRTWEAPSWDRLVRERRQYWHRRLQEMVWEGCRATLTESVEASCPPR